MNDNSAKPKCPRCGAIVAADAPEGLCPSCLVALNFASQTDLGESEETERTGGDKSSRPPAPSREEMAGLFPQLEILELLGAGGMGAVYKARQPKLDRFVALKVLLRRREDGTADPAFNERFAREARALARLNHPAIVAVYEYGEAGGYLFLIMEYVDGLTLRQLLRHGKLTPEEALGIVPKICEALQFAHQQGIVHRDIKPENVLLDRHGRVKIADFGIAKIVAPPGKQSLPLTGGKDVVGTPHYMAPEQVEDPAKVDHRADIFSLGVVFYEMLTGELPLGKFAPPSQLVKVDVRLDEVVLRALEKNPERRYQQASAVKTDLETLAGGQGSASVTASDWVSAQRQGTPRIQPPPSSPESATLSGHHPPVAARSGRFGGIGWGWLVAVSLMPLLLVSAGVVFYMSDGASGPRRIPQQTGQLQIVPSETRHDYELDQGSSPLVYSPEETASPQLRFLAWQGAEAGTEPSLAWYPNGQVVRDTRDRELLRNVNPGELSSGNPFLYLWFSHPQFDRLSVRYVQLFDNQGAPVKGDATSSTTGLHRLGGQGLRWLTRAFSPSRAGQVPAVASVVLDYSGGSWQPGITVPSDFDGRTNLADGVTVSAVGESPEGKAFVRVEQDQFNVAGIPFDFVAPAAPNTSSIPRQNTERMQFDFVARTRDGRELERLNIYTERAEPHRGRFQFDVPLAQVQAFMSRSRSVQTVVFHNVSLLPGQRTQSTKSETN